MSPLAEHFSEKASSMRGRSELTLGNTLLVLTTRPLREFFEGESVRFRHPHLGCKRLPKLTL